MKNKIKKLSTERKLFIILRMITYIIIGLNVIGLFSQREGVERFLFVTVQSVLFLLCSYIPDWIRKKTNYHIPNSMTIIFIFFCLCHFILGEINNFFEKISWWDSMLHTLSGVSLAILGICIVDLLCNSSANKIKLSPFFKCLFGFMFALSLGAIWEIAEFTIDGLFNSNMQRFYDYVGREALKDTMKDLILDSCGAAVICALFYVKLKKDASALNKLVIEKIKSADDIKQEPTNENELIKQ